MKPTRRLSCPVEKQGVDKAGERFTLLCSGEDEVGDEFSAAALELSGVERVVGVGGEFEAVVEAVGEGEEGEVGEGGFVGNATVGVEGGA